MADNPKTSAFERDYQAGLDALIGLCRAINLLPLAHMQDVNERMQALGPLLEPTAYHRTARMEIAVGVEQGAGRG